MSTARHNFQSGGDGVNACGFCGRHPLHEVHIFPGAVLPEESLGMPGKAFTAADNRPHDPVFSPSHYTSTKIAAIDVIDDWQLTFELGSVVKYISRHKLKNGIEDLKKAVWYLQREINNKDRSQECNDNSLKKA